MKIKTQHCLCHQQRLQIGVNHFIKIASITHAPIMGGVPAIAPTYEWKQRIVNRHNIINSGVA